jgi:acylphosphatase
MKVRAHVYVSGRVQGVFFRNAIANLAERLGVTGWVRNLSDGRVEALFEGEKEKIEGEIEFCKRGPPGAAVQNLQVKWEGYTGEFREFNVLY